MVERGGKGRPGLGCVFVCAEGLLLLLLLLLFQKSRGLVRRLVVRWEDFLRKDGAAAARQRWRGFIEVSKNNPAGVLGAMHVVLLSLAS